MQNVSRYVLSIFIFGSVVSAQLDQGQIAGTVMDSTQAIVVGAKVIAVSDATGRAQTTQTGANGSFVLTNLQVGLYEITVEASGFKKYVQAAVKVDAATRATLDVALALGLVTESVTVHDTAAQMQQETAQIGRVVDARQISDLALNGRNPINLALLKAGVIGGNFSAFSPDNLTNGGLSINGGQATTINITVDGVNAMRSRNGEAMVGEVNVDTIQEVQILTSTMPAEYGRTKDGQVRFVTKSGTREFHGTAWEFFRNSALDANTWARNNSPILSQSSQPAPFRFNQPGYAIGGPVFIPKTFNTGRDKLFFFVSQEFIRFRQDQESTATVPSLLMRKGDFSELLNPTNFFFQRVRALRDPLSGSPFPGNVISPSRLSHNGMALMNAYPVPVPDFFRGTSNWIVSQKQINNSRKDTFRLDYYAGKHRISFSGNNFSYHADDAFRGAFVLAPTRWSRPNRTGSLSVSSTLSPHVINEASFSAAEDVVLLGLHPTDGKNLWERSNYGVDFPYIFPVSDKIVPNRIAELTNVTSFTTLDANNRPSSSSGPMYTFNDSLTWLATSAHTLKFGANYAIEHNNNNDQTNGQSGIFTFLDTGNPLSTGVALGNLALGNYDTYNETGKSQYTLGRSKALETFAQDTWKVTPNLTVEYGVRFSYYQPWYAVWNDLANFSATYYDAKNLPQVDPRAGFIISGNPYNGIVLPGNGYPASAAGRAYGVLDPLSKGLFHDLPRSLSYGTNYAFAPRLGFAYKIADKTVIRVGGGVFNNRQFQDTNTLIKNPPNTQQANVLNGLVDNPGGGTKLNYLFTMRTQDWNYRIPTAYTYSYSVQRQLPGSTLLDVSYVGKTANHLPRVVNTNQLLPGTIQANPGINAGFLRPIFGLGDFMYRQFSARSNYNSLQVSVDRRFRSGLGFGVAYTFSRSIDDTATPYNAYNIRVSSKGLSATDRTHVLNLNYIYALPILNKRSGLTANLLGGWELSGEIFFRSGSPFSITDATDIAGVGPGTGTQRWNVSGNTDVSGGHGLNQLWFNPAAFTLPAAGTFGNSGLDILRGPAFQEWDLSLFKGFRLMERLRSELRFEAYNFTNHPVLGAPNANPRNATFGTITTKSGNRNLQVGLKFLF